MDLIATIRMCITKSATTRSNIFDLLIREIENYFHRSVSTMKEMNNRDSKKAKGDVWEQFCQLYLQSTGKYIRVWLFKEIPNRAKEKIGLPDTKQDTGIDIVAKDFRGKYYSVQCKYRGHKERVNWKTLGTFIGLSERCKFKKLIVMTNSSGVSRKVIKSDKDITIAKGTFRAIKFTKWKQIANFSEPEILEPKIDQIPETIEELRAARLKFFQGQTNPI